MDIFVYSDESGVFDCYHSRYFVFGGLVFLDGRSMQDANRRFQDAEKVVRSKLCISDDSEIKSCDIPNKYRRILFRATNREYRFGVIIDIHALRIRWLIADDKKSRQRYMDFAFKIAVKRFLASLIRDGVINPDEVNTIHFYADQHTTATNGKYELRESMEQEFVRGLINFETQNYYPPLFPNAKSLSIKFCDSRKSALIRAADVVANKIYRQVMTREMSYEERPTFYVYHLPDND